MTTARAETAKVRQILLWYDQPEILFLERSALEYVLAVSSAHADNADNIYVGASMTLAMIEEYQAGKCDLRFALAHANLRRYWTFSFTGSEAEVTLTKIRKSSDVLASSLPDAGFFSREHHRIELIRHKIPDAEEQFSIDGSWELGEFSKFYSQVEDIYYIFNDIDLYEDPASTFATKNTISRAFDRPWGGGGSYVAFYDKIANDNSHIAPLKVSGIKYNSPGYVAVKAKKKPFDNIIALLQAYADNGLNTRKAYYALNKLMSFSGFLKADGPKAPVTPAMRDSIISLSRALTALMPGVSFDLFMRMTGDNVVVSAKVLMSVFRRVEKLYRFFEEGRVSYQGLDTIPLPDEDS